MQLNVHNIMKHGPTSPWLNLSCRWSIKSVKTTVYSLLIHISEYIKKGPVKWFTKKHKRCLKRKKKPQKFVSWSFLGLKRNNYEARGGRLSEVLNVLLVKQKAYSLTKNSSGSLRSAWINQLYTCIKYFKKLHMLIMFPELSLDLN